MKYSREQGHFYCQKPILAVVVLAKILQSWERQNLMNMLKKLLAGVVVSVAIVAIFIAGIMA
jgi:hypothetical protein